MLSRNQLKAYVLLVMIKTGWSRRGNRASCCMLVLYTRMSLLLCGAFESCSPGAAPRGLSWSGCRVLTNELLNSNIKGHQINHSLPLALRCCRPFQSASQICCRRGLHWDGDYTHDSKLLDDLHVMHAIRARNCNAEPR